MTEPFGDWSDGRLAVEIIAAFRDYLRRLRGRKNHQHLEFFTDIEEKMFDPGRHKDHAARLDDLLLVADTHVSPAANHVIHLVFLMRLLRIDRAGRKHVNAHAQGRNAQEFLIELTLLPTFGRDRGQIVEVFRGHDWLTGTPPQTTVPYTAESGPAPAGVLPACTTGRSDWSCRVRSAPPLVRTPSPSC